MTVFESDLWILKSGTLGTVPFPDGKCVKKRDRDEGFEGLGTAETLTDITLGSESF